MTDKELIEQLQLEIAELRGKVSVLETMARQPHYYPVPYPQYPVLPVWPYYQAIEINPYHDATCGTYNTLHDGHTVTCSLPNLQGFQS